MPSTSLPAGGALVINTRDRHGHRPDGLQEHRDARRAEADVVVAAMLAPRDLPGGLDPDVEIIGADKAQPQLGGLGH